MGLGTYQGLLPFNDDNVAATVKQIKLGPGLVAGLKIVNTTAVAAYLQMFDEAASIVTLGTTPPYVWFRLSANESIMIALNEPITFGGSGVSIAGTTTPTGNTGAILSVTALYLEA
jgi:hypothetical protein